ncbi:alpha/beta hydrolase family protein [Lysobacter enzymogenes]|uniref:alpha/beta hydrolase family protein n=1 Tax=Lysobacter enzymogenes TaxID=69 RepID=UPI001A972235|nr:prolyl oligopeptidase family serine peptidase [Lysobacter enzymogenes]QQP95658.1 prolyl oligopeptidase family serine peptidase [Lysobacter enzymogenes]
MRLPLLPLLLFAALAACSQAPTANANDGADLTAARAAAPAETARGTQEGSAVPAPPPGVLQLVHYRAEPGELAAYLTPRPAQPGKHPAIVWLTGGDSNTLGDVWSPQSRDNDQSAAALRQAGIVVMYPSLRGGNDNPGLREGFYGEVRDVLAAADYLAKLDYVDPQRIYLGGHSTGGTLALLVAQSDARFRAVFAFGPTDDVAGYGGRFVPAGLTEEQRRLRSPGYWLESIRSPVFAFEGDHDSNFEALQAMRRANRNPLAHWYLVPRTDHFSVLAPTSELIARKILADTGARSAIAFEPAELDALVR